MKRLSVWLALAGAMVSLVLVVAQFGVAATDFTDPAGDSGGAPDITAVNVSNDGDGMITFAVTINQANLAPDAVVTLMIDGDRNARTGSIAGFEYSFTYSGRDHFLFFAKWNGTRFAFVSSPTVRASDAAGVVTIVMSKNDIGGVDTFDFNLTGLQLGTPDEQGRIPVLAHDEAPDDFRVWTYALTALSLTTTTTTPPPLPSVSLGKLAVKMYPREGRSFLISVPVNTNASSVKVSCAVKVGGKPVLIRGRYDGTVATCQGIIPRQMAGKWLVGSVTVKINGAFATKKFSFLVRR